MKKSILLKFNFIFLFFFLINNYLSSKEMQKEIFFSAYLKGINLASASGEIIIKSNKLYFNLNARTVGIFSIISEWQQTINVEATILNNVLKSKEYKSSDSRGKKKGHIYLKFINNFPKIISAQPDPREDKRRTKINKNLLKNTSDPVIGIINMGINGNCNNEEFIFDGKRKYSLRSKFLKKDKIGKHNFYTNEIDVIKCEFNIKKLNGYTKKEIKKYPKNGYIWYKKVRNNLYFPAKIEISTNWGSFICLIKEKDPKHESDSL
ncbi:MAG: hypothetical protein CMP40_01480 [Rickettsiales bacterium]|nr:hypothetical protein [Rickettsiales bacterium]